MSTRPTVIAWSSLCLLAACTDVKPPGEVAGSAKARLTTPAPPADLTAAVAGNTDFALDLYRSLTVGSADNLFISPASITLALSMAYAGAAGTTKAAFEGTLHQGLPPAAYHHAMNDLDRQLASRGQGAKASDGQPFRLSVANQLFAEQRFSFEAPFLDTLALEYGADVRKLDFVANADPSRVKINTWVEQRTESRIKDLLPPGSITPDTRAVLVNAIAFNAAWAKQFDPRSTKSGAFHALDGTTPSTQLMYEFELPARAATVGQVEVVSLPYDGGELSMLLLAPPLAEFTSFERDLTAAGLSTYVAALQPDTLTLTMPKFELRTSASLVGPLSQLGLEVAFSDGADFSGMSKEAPLRVSDVVHQSFVKVSESGTEAAAATGVIVGTTPSR